MGEPRQGQLLRGEAPSRLALFLVAHMSGAPGLMWRRQWREGARARGSPTEGRVITLVRASMREPAERPAERGFRPDLRETKFEVPLEVQVPVQDQNPITNGSFAY